MIHIQVDRHQLRYDTKSNCSPYILCIFIGFIVVVENIRFNFGQLNCISWLRTIGVHAPNPGGPCPTWGLRRTTKVHFLSCEFVFLPSFYTFSKFLTGGIVFQNSKGVQRTPHLCTPMQYA